MIQPYESSAMLSSILFAIYYLTDISHIGLYVNFLPLDVVVMLLAFMLEILANVHVRYAVARPSVVCNVRAPYSTG